MECAIQKLDGMFLLPLFLKLMLESDRATLMDHSKFTREQELKLTDQKSYRAVWYAVGHK